MYTWHDVPKLLLVDNPLSVLTKVCHQTSLFSIWFSHVFATSSPSFEIVGLYVDICALSLYPT